MVVFFYRNLFSIQADGVSKVMDVLIDCLSDENVEVREMASKVLSGVVRCSQRQQILPLKVSESVKGLESLYLVKRFRPGLCPLSARQLCLPVKTRHTPRSFALCTPPSLVYVLL
jgi:hypothetical protein